MEKELSDDVKRQLKFIVDHFDDEDRAVRDRQIRQWRRLKLLWENIQHTYYSEVAHDWRIPESERAGFQTSRPSKTQEIGAVRGKLKHWHSPESPLTRSQKSDVRCETSAA